MSNKNTHFHEAMAKLRDFLVANKLRMTSERAAILQAIYETDGPFTIDYLMEMMDARNFHVSNATLYATADVLTRANLLLRHPASTASALFQRIPESGTGCYQVCNCCHKVTSIERKEVLAAINEIPTKRFTPSHRITYIYGLCTPCKTKLRRTLRQQNKS